MEQSELKNRAGCFLKLAAALILWNASYTDTAAAADTVTLFTHVNVVPMDQEHVLPDQSVLVEGGRIKAIGPKLSPVAGGREIDGHGTEFLSPGLADMHVHSDTSRDMVLFLANGVTTILNMGDARDAFIARTRPRVNSGALPGPHIYAAFLVDGSPEFGHFVVTTAAEARAVVQLAKTNGYDFIKVYNNLSPECFMALIEQGKVDGLPVVGHGVTAVGIARQLAAGQLMVAHAEEYLYTVFFKAGSDPGNRAPELSQIKGAIELTKRARAFVTADLNTYGTIAKQWGKPVVLDDFLKMPETRYLDPDDRILWKSSPYVQRNGDLSARLAFLKVFCKALADAGVPLLTGTDTPSIPGLVPGFSLHQDLHALEEAGLSRYQVLSAATREPGELIARAKQSARTFGTVTVGERADFILSAANPLDDLSTLAKPLGVMTSGHWYDQRELQSLLNEVAAQYER